MTKDETIYRRQMLDELDIKRTPVGRPVIHSVVFIDGSGKRRFLPQCYVCGAGRMNNKEYRVRGFQPCDCQGHAEGHVYPVRIWSIIKFNGKEVIS